MKCVIDGCEKERKKKRPHCSMHAARIWRHGSPDISLAPAKGKGVARTVKSNGYVVIRRPGHPLAPEGGRGLLYEHRYVVYQDVGEGTFMCHWCQVEVDWRGDYARKLHIDHLDHDRTNNARENLVISCGPCNQSRQKKKEPTK